MFRLRARLSDLAVGATLLGLGVLLSTLASADPYKPHAPPQLWPDGGTTSSTGWAADPKPLRTGEQWALTFRYEAGRVQLLGARPVHLSQPVTTPRRIGRFAVELLSGPALIDRVRFDFPMLAADELAGQTRRPYNDPPRFEVKAVVTHAVLVPDSSRVSRARLVDRATGTITMLPWPPVAESADAGVRDAAADGPLDARADAPDGADASDAGLPDGWPIPESGPIPPFPRDSGPIPPPGRDAGPLDASR